MNVIVFGRPLEQVLEAVSHQAHDHLPRCDRASVHLVSPLGSGDVFGASDAAAARLEAFQTDTGEGPCARCLDSEQVEEFVSDTESAPRSGFESMATSEGVLGCLALPLLHLGSLIGVLNLYSDDGQETWDRDVCTEFARGATVVLSNAGEIARADQTIEDLQRQLEQVDDSLEQARGIVSEREHMGIAQANAALESRARREGRSVEDVAHDVIGSLSRDLPTV